jgi:hypothetical protein
MVVTRPTGALEVLHAIDCQTVVKDWITDHVDQRELEILQAAEESEHSILSGLAAGASHDGRR